MTENDPKLREALARKNREAAVRLVTAVARSGATLRLSHTPSEGWTIQLRRGHYTIEHTGPFLPDLLTELRAMNGNPFEL